MVEIQIIRQKDGQSTRMHAALEIYRNTILPEAQNPEKQILYWIEHSDSQLKDEFKCFSIQRGPDVVGYLQYSYFCEENIIFFEYLCLLKQRRVAIYNKDVLEAIEQHLANNYGSQFIAVFEVAFKRNDQIWTSDKKLVNYFTRLGFRKIEFPYRYPVLQSYDNETSYPADLMVRLPADDQTISASSYRTLLRCLYFKHYLRWDRPFLKKEEITLRERQISELYNKQIAAIDGNDFFNTSGDDKRSIKLKFVPKVTDIKKLIIKIFGTKLGYFMLITVFVFIIQRFFDNSWAFFPFMFIVFATYCLLQDTNSSRKLFLQIISKLNISRLQR